MNTQQPPPTWEDGIDLRKWLAVLVKHKWLILGIFAAAVAVSSVANYAVLSPVYQASGGGSLPSASSEDGLGMTQLAYQEFASSTQVMDAVRQKLGLELEASQLRDYYTFEVDQDQRFITVAATAETPEQAVRRVKAWLEAYDEQVQAEVQRKLAQLRSSASQQAELLLTRLTEAEEALSRFDLENPLASTESYLASLESELINYETRFRELTRSSIPADEVRLAFLQDILNGGNGTIGSGGSPASAIPPISYSDEGNPAAITIPNPAYLELGQNLRQARLSALESELVSSESRFRELTFSSIPIAEEKLSSLQAALSQEPEVLNEPGSPESIPQRDFSGQRMSGPAPNPVYLQLRQELVNTQVGLAVQKMEAETLKDKVASLRREVDNLRKEFVTNQERAQDLRDRVATSQEAEKIRTSLAAKHQEAEALEGNLASLRGEIEQLREQVIISRAARQELESQVAVRRAVYEPARAELDHLTGLEPSLIAAASLSTIREPTQPTTPVSPQKTRNLVLSGVLGAMLGISAALFLEYYRGGSLT